MLRRKLKTSTVSNEHRWEKDRVLGEEERAKESRLEEEVLGVAEDVLDNIEPTRKKKKRPRRRQIEESVKKWNDSDDEKLAELETITPSWAAAFEDDKSEDSDDEVLKTHAHAFDGASTALPVGTLDFKRVTDGNKEDPSKSNIKCIEFHRSSTVLMTGGTDCTLRLFAVDGNKNRKIHSVFLERTPIETAHFSQMGKEIIIGSQHRSFYVYDMEGSSGVTFRPKMKGLQASSMAKFIVSPDHRFLAFFGSYGFIHIFAQKSKELIESLKMNGSLNSACFSKDGKYLYAFGSEGKVYVWDMDTRDCVQTFTDDGCVTGTSVAVSPDDAYLVCGSMSGIVNVYKKETALSLRYPMPVKLIKNLTTTCSQALFNHSSEILAIRSKKLEKSVKLIHFPSMTAFANFPEQLDHDQKLLTCMDFSPSCGYFAVGNNKGRCLLYRLEHFSNY